MIPQDPQWLQLGVQKYLIFHAYGKVYLCLLKIFLFLSIRRLYFIQFLHEIYMEKVLEELIWAPFFRRPYCSNGTKIHLDAALYQHALLKEIILFKLLMKDNNCSM